MAATFFFVGTDEDLLALGREIRRHRDAKKLSQEKLAERAGLHRNYIGHLERGERNPRVKRLFDIARALGLSFAELTAGVIATKNSRRSK
ncbi:MAG TPA: helix-turn-helix transcriptional regulator [Rhizomicrobium sp.]|jgi:transcriptional regulator with XRE-family HTH domain